MRPRLTPRLTAAASVTPTPGGGWILQIPDGPPGRYRLAQLDDYAHLARRAFPWRPPLTLSLRARASAESLPGTWGFGLWNDPFGLSIGFGGNPFRLPALPNAAWFFHASPENYLSFRDLQEGQTRSGQTRSGQTRRSAPTNGFLAQTFGAPRFHPSLLPAMLCLPFSRRTTRRLLGRVIDEQAARVSVNVTQWHRYRLGWSPTRVIFEVDEAVVLEMSMTPRPPLGLVIWIDNQYAAFPPDGALKWGTLKNSEPAWLEIEEVQLNM